MTRRLFLSMLLGLLTATCVAWIIPLVVSVDGATATETMGSSAVRPDDWPLWKVVRRERAGLFRVYSMWLDRDAGGGGGFGFEAVDPRPLLPSWAGFANPFQLPSTDEAHVAIVTASGWPFHAVGGGVVYSSSSPRVAAHGAACFGDLPSLHSQLFDSERFDTLRVVPWSPRWWGLLGNSVVYGAGWWMALSCFVLARRRCRTRRGLCASCGYPALSGIRCPECGAQSASQ